MSAEHLQGRNTNQTDSGPAPEEVTMNDPKTVQTPISDRSGVTDAVRVQILSTEHWSLLATRSMTWNEIFSRASMFITVLSAAVVALALVAQATGFGPNFRLFALLVLPVVFLMGLVTFIRLGEANTDDIGLVVAMNRIRHAYMELAPELQPYFTTGHHDDQAGIMLSYGQSYRLSISRVLGGTPALVAAINVVVVGVIAALIAESLNAPGTTNVVVGILAALAAAIGHGVLVFRAITRGRSGHQPRFPS
jgi:hypothetical protein